MALLSLTQVTNAMLRTRVNGKFRFLLLQVEEGTTRINKKFFCVYWGWVLRVIIHWLFTGGAVDEMTELEFRMGVLIWR